MKKLHLLYAMAAAWCLCGYAEDAGWRNFNPERKMPVPAKLLWEEKFLSADDLSFSCRDGAEGRMELLPAMNGRGKLRLLKTNDKGYLVVTAKKTLTAKPGTELQTAVAMECLNANPNYALGFLRLYGKKENLSYFKDLDGRGGGGPKMHQITNSPAGGSERKLAHFLVTKKSGSQVHAAIVVAGMPSESTWSNWTIEDFKAAQKAWQERPRTQSGLPAPKTQDEQEFRAKLALEKQHTSQIGTVNGFSRLLVDGKVAPPVLYHGPVNEDGSYYGADFDRNGVHLMCLSIRFGNAPKRPGIWYGKDRFDAKAGADKVERAMRQTPGACYWLSLNVSPYPDFVKDHPDEGWVLADGKKAYGQHVHLAWEAKEQVPNGCWYWVSMHSQQWKLEVEKHLKALIAELKARNLDRRVVGIHLCGLHDAQFSTRKLDYGIPVQKGFPVFLKEKYGTPEALSKAWGRKISAFSEVKLPRFGKEEMLTPGKDQDQIDFLSYLKNNAFRQQEYWAHAIREAIGKPIVIGRWCQGVWNGDYVNAFDIDAFIASREVDILISQQSYKLRTPALGCGIAAPYSSFNANKKLWLSEFDLRTYAALAGNETELRVTGLSQAIDDVMWRSIHRKMAGMPISIGHAFWYLDMAAKSGGWFRPTPILNDIADVQKIHRELLEKKPSSWHPDVAFVADEAGLMLRNMGSHYYSSTENCHRQTPNLLASSGVPFDNWSLRDFLKDPERAKPYKVLIFWGLYHIDAPRQALLKSLQSDGRTLIYLSGTGKVSGLKATGFEAAQKARPAPQTVVSTDQVNQISTLQMSGYAKSLSDKKRNLPGRFSPKVKKGDKVRSRFADDNSPATVERPGKNYTSVYLGGPGGLTPEYFLELVRRAGGYSVCDAVGVQANVSGDFLSLHSLITGKRTIRLPRKAVLKNLKTGEETPKPVTEFPLDCEAGSTYWFELK